MKARAQNAGEATRIVELVGVPGAGKSTLCRVACDSFIAAGGVAWGASEWRRHSLARGSSLWSSPLRRPRLKLFTALAERRALWFAVAALLRTDLRWRTRLLALRLVLVNLENHRCARRLLPPGHLVLVDEGLLQLAVRLFVASDGSGFRDPSRYARAIPAPDLIVHLRAPADLAMERAGRRPRGLPLRFQHLGQAAARRAMTNAAALIDRLIDEVLASHPACRRVAIDAEGAGDVRRQVESLMAGLTSGPAREPQAP